MVIVALRKGVIGMRVGGVRRFQVTPTQGWRKGGVECDGGPGGSGAGGAVKTDYVIVPTAEVVNQEACFDKTLKPFPNGYEKGRRLAQRFDQTLIMEVSRIK